MPWIAANGVSFHYKLEGASGPSVIFLHEIGGSLDSWDALVPALSKRLRVFRYDQRGFGLTEKVRAQYSAETLVDDLEALIAATALPAPYHIVSLAASSMQALEFNRRNPSQVASLVFCNPAPGVDPSRADALNNVAALAEREGIRGVLPLMLDKSYPPELSDRRSYDDYRGRYLANDPVGFALAFRMMAKTNLISLLPTIKCPSLVIAGAKDFIRAVSVTEGIAKQIPGARFEIIEAGHFMPTTSPDALLQLLEDFWPDESANVKVKANGINFNCRIDGREGAPWLVLSNSLATNHSMWDAQVAALKDDFRILRYDQRGHGGSEAPPGPYPFDTLVDDVIALFDALDIDNAHFAGLSMGGMMAVALAEKYPGRVNRVAACDCGPHSTPQSAQQWSERIQIVKDKGMEALVEPTLGRWFPAEFLSAHPAVAEKVRTMIRTTPVNGFAGCCAALSDFDLKPGLSDIKSPMRFICGSKDAALPGCKALQAGVKGSDFVEIEGAGHISNLEKPEAFTKALKEFLLG